MSRYKEIDLKNQKRYSLQERESKVDGSYFYKQAEDKSLSGFISSLPDILQAREFKELIDHTYQAVKNGKPVIVALGGHVIKCGLSPLLIEMLELGVIKCLAGNGSVAIHDFEIALTGQTSEDVKRALEDGSFGMARETGDQINRAIIDASSRQLGYGEGIGAYIEARNAPYRHLSLFAAASRKQVPFTVHVAMGTDIVHQHKSADGSAIGDCSLRDFRIFCEQLKGLNDGGVFLNFGSAVIMPEVFLKGVTVVRNLGYPLKGFYTAVFDMNYHYRPKVNIVERPTGNSGKGYYFVGHHEIMIPLFLGALKERLVSDA